MAYDLKATDLVQPLGRFSRVQFGIVLLGAAAATGILLAAAAEIYIIWSFVLFWIFMVAVVRRLHDRNHSGLYFLVLLVPLVNVGMLVYLLLAPPAGVDPVNRGVCLEYYTNEVRIRLFQDREAERFKDALHKYESRLESHPGMSEQLVNAGKRIRAAIREAWRRRAVDLTPVPQPALLLYLRWQESCEAFETWCEAKLSAIEDIVAGGEPPSARLKMLLKASEKARREAEREENRFLKTWRLHRDAVRNMVAIPLMEEDDLRKWWADRPDGAV